MFLGRYKIDVSIKMHSFFFSITSLCKNKPDPELNNMNGFMVL